MKPLFCLSALMALLAMRLQAQTVLPGFGVYSDEEYKMSSCSFDPDAGAVILFDEAVSDHDEEWQLVTRHRVRIKIFSTREVDRANIEIPFYAEGGFETISRIEGMTANVENGSPHFYTLDRKTIYTEKKDKLYSYIRFALPNAKPGSIVEYSYESTKKNYGGLRPWVFQHDIPILRSCYTLTLLPGSEFAYVVQKNVHYPITIKPIPDEGKVYYEMNNLPGLVFEPFMDAAKDYLQRVEFQLSAYTRYGTKNNVNQTWKDLALELMSSREFGGALRKDLPGGELVMKTAAAEVTDSGKVASIYYYVRDHFTETSYYSIYASDGLRPAWEKRTGTATEINMILLNLLLDAGIEAYPLLAAERNFGKIDTTYPFTERFNKVVALVKSGGHFYVMDASEKFCPAFLTPYQLLNTTAFLVDKKLYNLVKVVTNSNAYRNNITLDARLDSKGWLSGTAEINSTSYARMARAQAILRDRKKFIEETIQEPGADLQVEELTVENLEDEKLPLLQKLKFHEELNTSGGFAFVYFNRLTGFVKNPFTSPQRFTNVNFGYPYHIALSWRLQLPPGSKVDKLPADKVVSSSNPALQVSRHLIRNGDQLEMQISFRQLTTLVPVLQYPDLKTLYIQINDLLNEPVVVQLPK